MGASRSRRAPRSHMRSLDLRGRMRSLVVNLSLWRTTAQPGIFEDTTCASGTPTARKSWKARFWTIAVAAVQTTVRGLGVTAYTAWQMPRWRAEPSSLCFWVSSCRGENPGPHRARQDKRKVHTNNLRSLFFRRTVSQKLRLIRIINEL